MPYNLMQGREPFFPAFFFSDYGNSFVFSPDMMMFFVE